MTPIFVGPYGSRSISGHRDYLQNRAYQPHFNFVGNRPDVSTKLDDSTRAAGRDQTDLDAYACYTRAFAATEWCHSGARGSKSKPVTPCALHVAEGS